METEVPLPCSKESVIGLEEDGPGPQRPIQFATYILILPSHPRVELSSCLFPSGSLTKIL
jgi:hypothetical protein